MREESTGGGLDFGMRLPASSRGCRARHAATTAESEEEGAPVEEEEETSASCAGSALPWPQPPQPIPARASKAAIPAPVGAAWCARFEFMLSPVLYPRNVAA
jgi:hypothetical protein